MILLLTVITVTLLLQRYTLGPGAGASSSAASSIHPLFRSPHQPLRVMLGVLSPWQLLSASSKRVALQWVTAAFPRSSVPIRHIPAGFGPSKQLHRTLQLTPTQPSSNMPRPLTSGATRASGLISKHSSSSRRGSQRGRSTTTRAYAAVPSVVDESSDPIIVAASWLGAKQRPFSK